MSAELAARPTTGRRSAVLPVAGGSYVAAWLLGLLVAPARPADAAPAELDRFVVDHGASLVTQSLLVHGLAGVALAVVAFLAGRHLETRTGLFAGLAAGALSLVQVGLLLSAVEVAGRGPYGAVPRLLAAVDGVDAVKLLALAVFVAATGRSGRHRAVLPVWLLRLGAVLVVLLVVGAASLVLPLTGLSFALFLALPGLLVHVGATALVVGRRPAFAGGSQGRS